MPSAPFTGNTSNWFWSNEDFATDYVWVTLMLDGYSNIYEKVGEIIYVWPVRGYIISGTVSGAVQSGVTVTLSGNAYSLSTEFGRASCTAC